MEQQQYINLEPNWAQLRRWAIAGRKAVPRSKDREPYDLILAECAKAKAAGRPDTDWGEEDG